MSSSARNPGIAKAGLDPLDLYDLRGELDDEERIVQDTVARFTDEKILPVIREAFEQHLAGDRDLAWGLWPILKPRLRKPMDLKNPASFCWKTTPQRSSGGWP